MVKEIVHENLRIGIEYHELIDLIFDIHHKFS